MKRVVIMSALAAALIALLLYSCSALWQPEASQGSYVSIGDKRISVYLASTTESQRQGLSGRTGLKDDEGMLFLFDADDTYGIWMKDMLFSIDILWLNSEGTVVHVVESAAPSSYPTAFKPPKPARYVLELPAGSVKRYNIEIGSTLGL